MGGGRCGDVCSGVGTKDEGNLGGSWELMREVLSERGDELTIGWARPCLWPSLRPSAKDKQM